MSSLPASGSRITTTLRSANNPLVQRFLGGAIAKTTQSVPENQDGALQLLEQVLTEVESSAQVVPQVIAEATDTLNVPAATSARRPEQGGFATPDVAPELASHIQTVDQEPMPELSPEVESYLEAVKDHTKQQPQEIVIADGSLPSEHSNVPVKKVVVLPITEEEVQIGHKKNPTWSIKWLVSWSERMIKMFKGAVVYR